MEKQDDQTTPTEYHILIVDDDQQELAILTRLLIDQGYRVYPVMSGELALQAVQKMLPDLILLDIKLPGMDGYEVCRHFKAEKRICEVPVMFISALDEMMDKVKAFEMGGVDYITKPFEAEEVLARVSTHLTIRDLQLQLRKEHERLHRLAEAAFEGIIIHDEGRILDVNQAVVQMFGFQADELLEKTVPELLAPQARKITTAKIRNYDEHVYETEGQKKDGSVFPLEVQMKSMPYQGHDVLVAAVRDLTWRKKMEQEQALLQRENLTLRSTIQDRYKFGEIIGKSSVMQEVYQSITNASASNANVLICGESGTGKELVAKTIHQLSDRKDKQFVAVNCGAVPETLFEREFFGHRKGAFTGATTDKPGYFDRAHKGTLFLDEVGELHPSLQVKLLRALQENEYTPLGDTVSQKVDVRIIAATNKDLKELLQQGLIREDFFYRIRVIVITLPPLRKRKEDIPLLIDHFLQQYGGREEYYTIPRNILKALCTYHWPGNVRELQNELQRYLAEQRLEFTDMPEALAIGADVMTTVSEQETFSIYNAMEEFEKRLITEVFDQNSGNRKQTAAVLGIDRKTLYTKLKKYGVI
jgi:PAS domain S-box-containing protein